MSGDEGALVRGWDLAKLALVVFLTVLAVYLVLLTVGAGAAFIDAQLRSDSISAQNALAAWPAAVLCLVALLAVVFRLEIGRLIDRIKDIHGPGGVRVSTEAQPPAGDQAKPPPSVESESVGSTGGEPAADTVAPSIPQSADPDLAMWRGMAFDWFHAFLNVVCVPTTKAVLRYVAASNAAGSPPTPQGVFAAWAAAQLWQPPDHLRASLDFLVGWELIRQTPNSTFELTESGKGALKHFEEHRTSDDVMPTPPPSPPPARRLRDILQGARGQSDGQ